MSISRTVNCRKTRFKLRQYGKRENIDLTLGKYPAHRYGVQGIFGVVQKPRSQVWAGGSYRSLSLLRYR